MLPWRPLIWLKRAFKSSRVGCMRRKGREKVLQLPWIALKGKLKANRYFFAMPIIS